MLTQEDVKRIFDYNPDTGEFKWKISVKGSRGKGNLAGTLAKNGYMDVCISGKKYGLHRLAFLYMEGLIPKCVDHINGCKSDNRWYNLRSASYSQNGYNYKGTGSCTGVRNVYQDNRYPDKYFVQLVVDGKPMRMGTYNTLEEASDIALKSRIKYHKEFAYNEQANDYLDA